MMKNSNALRILALFTSISTANAGSTLFVDQNATGPVHDGSSWCSAFLTLNDALSTATASTTIRIADGTYLPDPTGLSDPREATFTVPADVTITGAFAGCNAPDPDAQSPDTTPTILSGDLNNNDGPDFANNDDNAYHIVSAVETGVPCTLEQLTITAANATGSELFGHHAGGAVLCRSSVVLRDCRLINNHADRGGAAILLDGGPGGTLERCIMTGNVAEFEGGAVLLWSSSITMDNCLLADNHALTDSGGAISTDLSQADIINTTCVANSAGRTGGGAFNYVGTKMNVTNSIFYGNTDENGMTEDSQITVQASNILFIDHSCMQGWTGFFGGVANSGDDPQFVNPASADYHLAHNSPYINAGDNNAVTLASDLDNNPRIADGTVDLGPYEFHASAVPATSRASILAAAILLMTVGSVVVTRRDIPAP